MKHAIQGRLSRLTALGLTAVLLTASGCHRTSYRHDKAAAPLRARTVAIQVEVYDPVTNLVWENVGVRIVEASVEGSGCICTNPDRDDWYYTDDFGVVDFDAKAIALAEVGFEISDFDEALLSPHVSKDEATVLVEVYAEGYRPVLWEVDISWDRPDAFVQIPFGDLALTEAE